MAGKTPRIRLASARTEVACGWGLRSSRTPCKDPLIPARAPGRESHGGARPHGHGLACGPSGTSSFVAAPQVRQESHSIPCQALTMCRGDMNRVANVASSFRKNRRNAGFMIYSAGRSSGIETVRSTMRPLAAASRTDQIAAMAASSSSKALEVSRTSPFSVTSWNRRWASAST